MRIGINLSSDPFRRDRPMLIGSAVVGVLMIVTLGALIWLGRIDRKIVANDQRVQARLDRDLARLSAEQRKLDGEVRRPENAEVLERSVLLNTLLLRKGISWTRIFADLEKTMPPNVRVMQIRPQVNGGNQIYLEMTIAADSPDPMVAFLAKLEGSDAFGSATITTFQAPSQTNPFYQYRLSVNYAQKF
jgi:Tfp pilus assembly protein PilN